MIKLFFNKVKSELFKQGAFRKLSAMTASGSGPVFVRGIERGFLPFLLTVLQQDTPGNGLVIVPSETEAADLAADLSLLMGNAVLHFPAWQNVPYSDVSSQAAVFQKRSATLAQIIHNKRAFMVASLKAALCLLPPPAHLRDNLISIKPGDVVSLPKIEARLAAFGYTRVPRVSLPSEFALRGEVLDVFVACDDYPTRILFDFDTVGNVRKFDPVTQLSLETRAQVLITPVHELVISSRHESLFVKNAVGCGVKQQEAIEFLEKVGHDPEAVGLENYIPLFFESGSTLLSYFPGQPLIYIVDYERCQTNNETLLREYGHQYQLQKEKRIVFSPDRILADFSSTYLDRPAGVYFTMHAHEKTIRSVSFACDPPRSFFGNIAYFKQEIERLIQLGYTIAVFADYETQAERIRHITGNIPVEIFPLHLSYGFGLADLKIIVIVEGEIFKRKKHVARLLRTVQTEKIDSFIDLEEGDYVVHIQHGIGCYRGIERVRTSVYERDYIKIEYAEKELIFLPTEQVNLIERYIAPGGKPPRLDKIGGKAWTSRKERVKQAVAELAQSLLRLYSLRKQVQGFSFPQDTEWQEQFESEFPYEETPDQLVCIADAKRDMEGAEPMDRLICGDVGYGKTEIALRAAFKAVMGGKQVALLAPTTILTEQHYETFTDRFEKYPVKIRMLSRFVSRSEQKKIIGEIANNETDIVIGTHRLVQRDIQFKNLGLLIIDEEQRFGVRHKERIKELKTNVDCLTLTATPIPRTLYMALMKIRDMSLINTPPRNRLPIETFVLEFNPEVIISAVVREIERGGQVFYLHNRIETIASIHAMLVELFPSLRVAVAHGRMEADELEDVMHGFIRRDYHILVATAIIENGIDIPNVNTIIIDRADMLGISQLYQLRGRVGRSDLPAFAYLLYPRRLALSERAMKRLKIISDFTELGSGFKIALKDLEMRGAGNLLGKEQHGDILSVGFDMYMKLLHEAITEAAQDNATEPPEVYLDLEYSGFIPDSYISEPLEKMETYKQIAAIVADEDLERVYAHLEDRFGPLPDELVSILSIAELRIICHALKINSLKERRGVVRVEFQKVSHVSASKVVRLIRESGQAVYLKNTAPQCIFIKTGTIGLKEKSLFIKERLSRLL